MSGIQIRIYEVYGGAVKPRKLLRTLNVDSASGKSLTARRAAQIVKRFVPSFKDKRTIFMSKCEGGFHTSRTVRPIAGCSYHYIWEEVVVSDNE